MKRLLIVGASGHGKVVADAALLSGWDEVVFADARYPEQTQVRNWPVISTEGALDKPMADIDGVVVAIGHNRTRLAIQQRLANLGWPIVTIIHPRATVSPFALIGIGSVLCAGAVVNVDAVVGAAAIINTGAVVEHDCVLGAGVHVSPNAALAGGVTVDDCTWIGMGACVRQLVQVGSDVVVGASAAVVGDVLSGQTVKGVPAT